MVEEKIKDGLCLPSGSDSRVDLRQMVSLNLSKNNVHECPMLRALICKRSESLCLPNRGKFSRVEVLP